jgi:hypothetical protein
VHDKGEQRAPDTAGEDARYRFCLFCWWANGTGMNDPRHGQPTDYTRYSAKLFSSPKLSA